MASVLAVLVLTAAALVPGPGQARAGAITSTGTAAQARLLAAPAAGWLVWAYCGCGDPTTSGSPSTEGIVANPELAPSGSNVNQAMLAALAVPHPELVAGTPASYGFDTSASTFTLDYSTERADGSGAFPAGSQTTVAVPAIQYPSGYQVVVSGAKVVSEGGILTLASCSGAAKVSLTVEPGSGVANGC